MEKIDVLDKGYVILHEVMGNDLTIANSARVSYNKKKDEMGEGDKKLIRFLAREGHTSPFRHATLQFEVYAPLMVARQWWKYVVGSDHVLDAWNESSRRYITEEPVFYVPDRDEWRSAPENSKQGSGETLDSDRYGLFFTDYLEKYIEEGERLYQLALKNGMCAEQARLFLPAYGLYVRWYWTTSLQALSHFLNQRLKDDAQVEIQEFSKAVEKLAVEHFPISLTELTTKKE